MYIIGFYAHMSLVFAPSTEYVHKHWRCKSWRRY